ncbi:MAG: hypothetical protein CK543_05740 [Flavobacteriales bacterium]|nr:MAG: hypothetical protein CK543_05740 [Flavobacteriales bacterium]
MYIPFEQLPDQSRVWVYQANRPLTGEEMEQIRSFLMNEMNAWAAHGAPLNASFEIRFNHVVIVAVNEDVNQASGCSIDASTHWFKSLGEMLHIDFFDRQIAKIRGEQISLIPITSIKDLILSANLLEEDFIIPPQTSDLNQYRNQWLQTVRESWLKKYFVKSSV